MQNDLARFMIALSEDPAQMAAFAKDPDLVLARSGLSAAEREVAKSGDAEAIGRHLGLSDAELLAQSSNDSNTGSNQPHPRPPKGPTPPPKPEVPKPKQASA